MSELRDAIDAGTFTAYVKKFREERAANARPDPDGTGDSEDID